MTDIAIVGIDCRFPKAANKEQLWDLLLAGADGIGEVPTGRWRDPGELVNHRSGGFIADADAFDHEFFGIPRHEAAAMDPQQRLLLQTAWRALEDAALDPRAQAGSATGVFVGVMSSEWAHLQLRDLARITPQLGTGNGQFMTANRLSYQLDLKGPSMAVDTACSSSLVAVQLACDALRGRVRPGVGRWREPGAHAGAQRLLHPLGPVGAGRAVQAVQRSRRRHRARRGRRRAGAPAAGRRRRRGTAGVRGDQGRVGELRRPQQRHHRAEPLVAAGGHR